jgi:hypothetical protein
VENPLALFVRFGDNGAIFSANVSSERMHDARSSFTPVNDEQLCAIIYTVS